MLRLPTTLALGALLALPGLEAMAIGFGRVGNATVLGQGLNFTVTVRLEGDESIAAECVSVEVFSGENRLPSSAVRVTIEPGAEPAERTLRVSSSAVIDEPVVGVNLQLACPNRLARKFVAFIDPPLTELARAEPVIAMPPEAAAPLRRAEAPSVRTLAAAAPRAAAEPAAKAAVKLAAKPPARVRKVALAPAGAAPTVVMAAASPATGGARKNAPSVKSARVPAVPSGVRLELQAADDAVTRERVNLRTAGGGSAPVLAPTPADIAASAAAAAVDEDAAQRAREREQMLAMQDSLSKLRAETQATRASLAQIQLRLVEAEQQRYANPLVFGLAALAAALAAALGFLLWRHAAERRAASEWWSPRAPSSAPPMVADASPDVASEDDDWGAANRHLRPAPRTPLSAEPALAETTASPMLLSEVHALAQTAGEESLRGFERVHEMSVEELMDLEQQAEFFVVLGQEEAAIDLLMGHLRSSGGASPLPYLKLLEIFRRRNEREAFERVRERFNRRFNAYAPDWQADPQQGRALLDYASVVERLQSLWARPTQAMLALEASLFRRDAGTSTFDLPAYRELLLLYSVARDLSEREAAPVGVDLLLPLGGEGADAQPLTRLHPRPLAEQPPEVDLEIASLDAGPSENDDRPSRFHTDFSPTSGYMGLPGEAHAKRA